jgi:hypothetical protein
MSSNNPTGMGDITALRFRKMARDIQMYNSFNQNNNSYSYQQSNTIGYAPYPHRPFIERVILNIFR